ncbi:MAG: hypothetical protein ACXW3L_12090, partial [Limisphaerales bacterium]
MARIDALAETLLASVPVDHSMLEVVLESAAHDSTVNNWAQLSKEMEGWNALIAEREKLHASVKHFDEPRLLQLDLKSLQTKWSTGQSSSFPMKWFRSSSVRRELRTTLRTNRAKKLLLHKDKVADFLSSAVRLKKINDAFDDAAPRMAQLLGPLWSDGTISAATLEQVRLWADALYARLIACAQADPDWLARFSPILVSIFKQGHGLSTAGNAINLLTTYREAYHTYTAAFESSAAEVCLHREPLEAEPDYLSAQSQTVTGMISSWALLRSWTSWQKARHEAETLGLGPIITRLESADTSLNVKELFERSFRRALLFAIIESEQLLRDFFGPEHDERIERFRKLDDQVSELSREVIRARLSARIPREQLEDEIPKAELGFLRKEVGKKTGHLAVRQLLSRIPQLLPRLKPCVLMSPLSVAQYLEASHQGFDLVI